MKQKDHSGKTYGSLTAVKRVERPTNISQGTFWLCDCNCGENHCKKQTVVKSSNFLKSNVSCGGEWEWKRSEAYKEELRNKPTRTCTQCGEEKSKEEFSLFNKTPDGRRARCKICEQEYSSSYYDDNKKKISEKAAAKKNIRAEYIKVYSANNKDKIKEGNKRYYIENKDVISVKSKEYRDNNKDKKSTTDRNYRDRNRDRLNAHHREYLRSLDTTLSHLDRLIPEDEAEVIDGVITVVCRLCGKRFAPLRTFVINRIAAVEGRGPGECNFYCSDLCRNACPLHGFHPEKQIDSRSKLYTPKSEREEDRACQTDHLKQLQCDERGHNWCEKCGDIIDVELHHTQPVGSKDAVSSAGHLLLCAYCHTELEASCRL